MKHLRLHKRLASTNTIENQGIGSKLESELDVNEVNEIDARIKAEYAHNVPLITPINEPQGDDKKGKARMTNLLDENPIHRLLTEKELKMMPALVEENKRFACSHPDCSYCTLDETMLHSHIQALHSELASFVCPHCIRSGRNAEDSTIEFEDLEFHLKCHGELLFKCCYCPFYHWQKRTAEKHSKEEHPTKSIAVKHVRKDSAARELLKKENGESKEVYQINRIDEIPDQETTYRPFRCSICDSAQVTKSAILEHIAATHDIKGQFKCIFCTFTSYNSVEIGTHFKSTHMDVPQNLGFNMIRLYYVDPYNVSGITTGISAQVHENMEMEEKIEPLWRRDMPGLKHIRGILYEEYSSLAILPPTQTSKPRTFHKKLTAAGKDKNVSTEATTSSINTKSTIDAENIVVDIDEAADNFPMKCTECNLPKKTIKGLKMHIKLMHLRTGKFLCQRCEFSANILSSINTHYKIKHPDAEKADFEEKKEEAKTFGQEYWKDNWLIPTIEERKKWVEDKRTNIKKENKNAIDIPAINKVGNTLMTNIKKKKFKAQSADVAKNLSPATKRGKKVKNSGLKRKLGAIEDIARHEAENTIIDHPLLNREENDKLALLNNENPMLNIDAAIGSDLNKGMGSTLKATDTIAIQEISHFEQTPTYRCQYCPKRTQNLERIERHLKSEHPERSLPSSGLNQEHEDTKEKTTNPTEHYPGYRILSRDQVVDMLTLRTPAPASFSDTASQLSSASPFYNASLQSDYICFYCDDVVGTIYELKAHFVAEHEDNGTHDRLKVKKLRMDSNRKIVNGYLECQVCGYLSGGFDRTKQRIHFHEEHPLEEAVNVAKYVLKQKSSANIGITEPTNQPNSNNKFDPSKFIGMTIVCPKSLDMKNHELVQLSGGCSFETKSMATMNGHLKKHTITYKCGHCGKTHSNSSEFHQHTAMFHGNKIPDLVKDPEAEANFQALKGLVEANLQIEFETGRETQNKVKEESTNMDEIMQPHNVEQTLNSSETNQRRPVARKSTAGRTNNDIGYEVKEKYTARKSTSTRNITENEYSYYGYTPEAIEFSRINTQMSMGGMPIVLNVAKMSEIININPQLRVEDCMFSKAE